MFVLDASRTLAFCLSDEQDEATDRTLARLEVEAAIAPAIWSLEVANGLRMAIRRGRIDRVDLPRLRGVIADLGVELVADPADDTFSTTLALALEHDLTVYDASYLGLAQRRGLPLATGDARLLMACERAGVAVID